MDAIRKAARRDNLVNFKRLRANSVVPFSVPNDTDYFKIAAEYDAREIGMYLYQEFYSSETGKEWLAGYFNRSELLFYLRFVILTKPHTLIKYTSMVPEVFEYALTKGLLNDVLGNLRGVKDILPQTRGNIQWRLFTIGIDEARIGLESNVLLTVQPTFARHEGMTDDLISYLALYDNVDVHCIFNGWDRLKLIDCVRNPSYRPVFLRCFFRGIIASALDEVFSKLKTDQDMSSLGFLEDHYIKPSSPMYLTDFVNRPDHPDLLGFFGNPFLRPKARDDKMVW